MELNHEQLVHELERKHMAATEALHASKSRVEALEAQVKKLKTDSNLHQQHLDDAKKNEQQVSSELAQVTREKAQLEVQLRSVVSLSDQRLEEIRVERERAAEQAKQLVELQTSETRALQAQARLEAQLAPLQHELSRLQKERENDRYQIEELQTQLVEKSRVLTDFRLKHNKKFAELEHQYAESKDQVDELKQSLQRVQDERKTLKEDLRHAQENVLELQTEHTRAIGYLEKELSAQHRLADLYKDAASDANLQVESLKAKCEALQASLQEAEDALAEESQKVREETQQATLHLFKEQTETSEKKIDELETELKKSMARIQELEAAQTAAANRISAIAELSPTAGDLHLASNGLSPTDMYSRIVDLDKQLQEERSAKETMEKYLERILAEVQAKAPYIDRLKKEQARALASHDQLSERLDICMHELSRAREHLRTAQSEKKIAETERDTLQQSVNDLSKQIQQLLYQSLNSNALSVDSTESLVVFRNVEELQTRNQQLLQIVRELSEKKAEKAGPVVVTIEPDDVCTSAEWEKVQDELNTLRAEREREQEMVAAIVKQRDMYRVLLSQSDTRYAEAERTKDLTPSSPRRSAPIDLIASESYDARLLRELRLEFDDYKKEKQAVVTELRDTLDALRVESSKAKMSAMEAKVQVKTLEEKCALVETRKAESDKELVRIRSKFEQSNSLLIQTQKQVADLTVKLDVGQSELRKLHGDLEKAKTEVEFLTKQEERHKTEITTLRSEQTNQVKLMEAVRRIEAHQTDRQAQELDRLQSVVMAVELKLAEKQRELDNAQSLSSAKIAELQLEGKALRKQLDSEKVAHGSVREAKAALDEKVKALNAQVKSLSEEVAVLKVQLKKGAGVAAAERVSSLETALQDAKQELHAALNAKQAAEQHAEQYKVISEANEKSFTVLSASSEKLKSEHDAVVSALQEELSQAKQELSALQKKVIKNIAEENKLREEMDSWDQTKREDLRKANERVLVAESQLSSCKQELTVLKGTMATLEGDLQAAQENYSRELSLHSAAVQKLNEMRKEVDSAARTTKEVEIQRDELRLTLDGIQAKYDKEIQGLKQTVEEAQGASSSLSEQNALLHSQLEVLTQDFNRLQEAATLKAFQERVAVPEQEQEKQVRELRSIISSLRRDLEIAQSKFDVAKQEALRYQTQIKSLEKSVDRLKAEQEVSKQQQVAFLTSDEQNKRSAQLDTLSLLRESNAMLRDENEKNHKKCQEKDAIIQGLEAKIHPLQTSESLLKSQIQTLKEDMESLNQSNKRWKNRVNQLIEKYQQIDPEEHEKVCAERNALKARVDELVEASQASNEDKKRIEELMTEKKHAEERLARMRLFVKDWQQQAKAAKERVTELEANKAELEGKASSERESEKAALDEKVKTLEDQLKVTEQKLRLNEEKLKLSEAEMKSKLDSEGKKNSALKDMNAKLLQRCNVFRQEIAELKARPEVQEPPAQVQPPLPPQSAEKPKEDAVEATPAETETSEVPTPVVESSSTAPPLPPQTVEEPAAPVNPVPPASPPLSAEDPKASTSVADEEKMRELALRSLLLKSKKIPKEPASPARPPSPKAAATAPPVPATSALTVETAAPPASTLNAAAPVFTSGFSAFVSAKGLSATGTLATQEKPSEIVVAPKSTNPFLNLTPPSATGGSTGLVFGKPNITLPVPTISTDASTAAASTVVIDSEAEELKRQERALRFNAEKPNKRPAPAAAEGAAPSKKANTDASAADEEETKQDNEGNAGPHRCLNQKYILNIVYAWLLETVSASSMMASTMSTSSLREALQALGISSNTPGVRGDERRAILLARYMEATGGGGGGVKPGTSTAQQMSMTDLRRELELRGINTNTPGLRGDDRRAALLLRWQIHCQQPVVAAPDHEDHGESNNRMEEAQDSMADPMAQPSTSPLKRNQQLKAEAKRLQVDIDAIQQAKAQATTDDKERKTSKLGADLENEKIAALHDLQERIKKQSLVGFNEIRQVSKEDERRTSPTKPTNKRMNPLLQTQTLTGLRRQMLQTTAAMTSRSDSPETVNRDRIHSFPIMQPTALSLADSIGRKAFFLHRIKGDFAAAEAAYNEAIDADPTHSVNLGHFALFLDRVAKRCDDAEEFYLRAIDASSEIPMHLSLYANFLNRVRHDTIRAEEYYLRCLRDFPRDADTLGNYANFLRYTKHDFAAASSYFAKALAVDPSHANNLSQFASLLSEMGQLDRADACYQKAIQLDGDNPTICGNYANLLVKQFKLDAAKTLYLKAMQLDPDSHIAQQNYAIFLRDHPSMRTGETRRIAMHPKDRWAMSVKQTTQLVRATAAFQQQNPPVH